MEEQKDNSVNIGCLSLITIALIVFVFSRGQSCSHGGLATREQVRQLMVTNERLMMRVDKLEKMLNERLPPKAAGKELTTRQ